MKTNASIQLPQSPEAIYRLLCQKESDVRADSSAQSTILAIRKLALTIDTGGLDFYQSLLLDAIAEFHQFSMTHGSRYPIFSNAVGAILNDYRSAWDIVQSTPQSGSRMFGGGFGLGGFLIGAAVSAGVNSLLDASDKTKMDKHMEAACQLWRRAVLYLTAVERIFSEESCYEVDHNETSASVPNTAFGRYDHAKAQAKAGKKTILGVAACLILVIIVSNWSTLTSRQSHDSNTRPIASPAEPETRQVEAQSKIASVARAVETPAPKHKDTITFQHSPEPNWTEREAALRQEYERTLKKPDLSKEVVLTYRTGKAFRGVVSELLDDAVILKTQNMSITLQRNLLNEQTQAHLWPPSREGQFVYATLEAEKKMYREQEAKRVTAHYDALIAPIKKTLFRLDDQIRQVETSVAGRIIQVVGEQEEGVLFDANGFSEIIYIAGLGRNHVDGDRWSGQVYHIGAQSYTTVLGASKKVHKYSTQPPRQVSEMIRKFKDTELSIRRIEEQKQRDLIRYAY